MLQRQVLLACASSSAQHRMRSFVALAGPETACSAALLMRQLSQQLINLTLQHYMQACQCTSVQAYKRASLE